VGQEHKPRANQGTVPKSCGPSGHQTSAKSTKKNDQSSRAGNSRYLVLRRLGANFLSFTDGHFVPLGGQHISAALLQVYKKAGGQSNDSQIPDLLQFLDAEVLRTTTPLAVCRLAAGEHQAEQKDVQQLAVSDAFAFLCKTAKEKKEKQFSSFLTDNEVLMTCLQLGLQKFKDKQGNEMSEDRQVY